MSRLEKESSFCSAASTFQEGLKGPKVSTNQLLRVTLLSSEWRSLKGGLSTINRELAIELAKHPNVEVYVYLPKCSEEDKKIAGSHNVQLIEAEELPGFEPIDWLTSLPKGHLPHCLIGHGLRLGRQIQVIKRHHNCKWIQVVHTAPEELGMYKCYEEAISKGEQKHQAEVKLCELADQVVAVGPKLADAYSRYLRFSGKDQDVINLTPSPSIFTEFHSVQQATEERSSFCVLVFGRGDNEDFKLKGYDIAVQAVSRLKDSSYQLMLVGAPTGKEDDVAAKLLEYGIRPSQLTVRRFKESREELAKLFCEVDLAIMPSRTEGFGLTALEALSAGLPILVSGNSGLGDALKKVPSGFSHVVDSENPKEWAKAIKIARQKDREVRLDDAKLLREKFAAKYSWQKQCSGLVEKMLLLTFGSFSPGQPSAVDGSLSLSCGACATSKEPVAVMFHREEEGRTKQDVCQGRKNLEGKNSSTSCKFLSSILDGLWQHQLPNFEMEQAFNIVSSQLEPHCSVCSFFSKLEDDISAHLRENLHLPLASLTADSSDVTAKMSIPRVPEICFMSDDSRPESISSWLDNKFAADTASPLLRCELCKLLVHASCYGVSDAPSDGHWQCQRCLQEDQKAIESSYCSLCRLGGGALKRTTDNRWAHLGCAVALPEVFFVNVNLREGINTNQITSARRKLKCFYCRSSAKGKDNGACVQCCAGKCAISFHVTCLVLAGFALEPSWPQPTETYCERHQQTRFKGKQRDFSAIHSGESVVAKHRSGRYYQGVVQNTSTEEYYVVDFEDGTYSENLPPTDIVSHDSTRGGIPWGTEVRVKWGENEDIFKARVTGRRISITYHIEFGDKSCLSVRRQDVYKANEDLPLKVQQRLGKQRDFSVIHSGESVVAKHRNGRYYHGVVQDTSTEEYYVVDFEDGTYSENLPPTDIVSHDSARDDIPWGTEVRVKWGENEDIFKARVTGRRISVAYQIEFEDKSWLSVRREDVYKANEDLPLKVQQRLSSATEQANLSYWDDIPDRSAKRRRKQNPHFL